MHTQEITCPRCGSPHLKKNGTTANQKQRYRCKACARQFITRYTYRAYLPLVQELIVPMTLNGSGIRDTARVLRISPNTVLNTLRAAANAVPEPRVPKRLQDLEMDEQWSFVRRKDHPCWLWHGLDRATREIVAFVLGRRTDASCRALWRQLKPCHIAHFYSDDWASYAKCLPAARHHMGKAGTQNIERHNLNFRTHLKRLHRRTICFSKSWEMHAVVIKLYVHHLNLRQHHF